MKVKLKRSNRASDEDTLIDMTPGGMPSPPHREVGDLRPFLVEGDWEMILNAMVWTEGKSTSSGELNYNLYVRARLVER